MISYSAKAAKALAYLKRSYNDIDIYVEDTANPNMWLHIIGNLLPSNIRLTSVNMLAGRARVLEACKLDQGSDGRRKLYVIDGDYDYILKRPKPRFRHLYRVPGYCVENILLHPDLIVEAAFACTTHSQRSSIGRHLDLPNLIGKFEQLIKSLWILNATSENLCTGLRTSSFTAHQLVSKIDGKTGLDEAKIMQRIVDLSNDIASTKGRGSFLSVFREIAANTTRLPLTKIASGKDFLLPIVWLRLRDLKDFTVPIEHFKVQLAKLFREKHDQLLARRLQSICS